MAFPPSLLDEIRARIPVSEVVGRRVTWDRRKTNAGRGDYWACCPFHNEKTASFHADDRKGRYHCFGCGVGGDIFRFLMETEGLGFPEAVETLARQAGLEVPKADPREAEREARRTTLYDVMEKAAAFFEGTLHSGAGRPARGYLEGRGLTDETIARFRLGYATSGRYALKEHLAEAGVTSEQMVESGLLVTGDDIAVPFDRFRDRVIFPIPDSRGRIIAFGGRALSSDAQAKYLNSPDTPLFSKRGVLYNFLGARRATQETGTVIVAEGYTDVIALAQGGFANAVAPLGTALTERQIALLWRLAPEPVLCFDGDAAGERAALRAVETALPGLKPGFSLRFAFLPEGQDPDDVVRLAGAEAMRAILGEGRPLIDVLWQNETREAADTPEKRAAIEARLDDLLSRIDDERVRRHYRDAVTERLDRLWRRGRWAGDRQRSPSPRGPGDLRRGRARPWMPPPGPSSELRRHPLARGMAGSFSRREALILIAAINHPSLIEGHMELLAALDLTSPELDSLKRRIVDIAASAPGLDEAALKAQLRDHGFATILNRIEQALSHGGDWFARPGAAAGDAEIGWMHTVARQRKAITLTRELEAAERAFSEDATEDAARRLADAHAGLEAFEGNEVTIEGYGETRPSGEALRSLDEWIEANRDRLPRPAAGDG